MALFLGIIVTFCSSLNELYFTASELKDLVSFERDIGAEFLAYYQRETARLDRLEKFLDDVEMLHNRGLTKDIVISNAPDSYKLLKRFLTDWKDLDWIKTSKESLRHFEVLTHYQKGITGFKESNELRGSHLLLFRLQDTYKLSVSEMVSGLRQPAHELSYDDIHDIAMYANHFWMFQHGIDWASYVTRQFENLEVADDLTLGQYTRLSDIYDIISWGNFKLRNYSEAIKASKKALKLDRTGKRAIKRKENIGWYESYLVSGIHPEGTVEPSNEDPLNRTLQEKRCRREEILDQEYVDTLFCKYHTPHPQFYLKPLKQERVYHEPRIDLYHGILSDFEVDHIKESARMKLHFAQVYDVDTGKLRVAEYRTSKNTWLHPYNDSVVARVINRVGALGNLDMTYSEPLQVANYGIGGNYEAHYDFAEPPHDSSIFGAYDFGNRIATMLFYLETVERGGDTTFIKVRPGISTSAVKGSGVFWHNLKKNGEGDFETKHAACPVLLGEKWVSNLWIHEHGQEFRHPCSLNSDE